MQNRIPFAHDTLGGLLGQYLYYNEFVQNKSIIMWNPFIGIGQAQNYTLMGNSILLPIFLIFGLIFNNFNYLLLFYFTYWFQEIIFLGGVILLSSQYYKDNRTILVVSGTLLGTCIFYPNVDSFISWYLIPIIIYGLHKWYFTFSIISLDNHELGSNFFLFKLTIS